MNLSDRQKEILASVVREYSNSGKPVSSKELIENYSFAYSPATIRAEMNTLEDEGLLEKPHTSAGRIPTAQGYRYYVNEIMQKGSLADGEKRKIKVRVDNIRGGDDFSKEIAIILANFSESLALVGRINEKHLFFSGLEDLFGRIDHDMFSHIAHFLEEVERDFDFFFEGSHDSPSVFIGQDHPFLQGAKCGLVLTRYNKDGEEGILALLGPDRMNYERNLCLLNYINELFT
jgi:transcriptional regulator of heat shock response